MTERRAGGGHWSPISADALPGALAGWLADGPEPARVALDGPPCTRPGALAEALVEPLRLRGRPAVHVRADSFWRDASLRLEPGREDPDAYAGWLDADALRREVLVPLAEQGRYLPSLRDPATNRSTRAAPQRVPSSTVLLVSGALLLGLGLPFDRVIHLAMSPAARARHTPAAEAWTLPAFDTYDAEVRPAELADVVVRLEHPQRPAVCGLP